MSPSLLPPPNARLSPKNSPVPPPHSRSIRNGASRKNLPPPPPRMIRQSLLHSKEFLTSTLFNSRQQNRSQKLSAFHSRKRWTYATARTLIKKPPCTLPALAEA